ncbi:MAG: FlhC family transcriptional regulator [Methylococcales bacterium]
MMHILFQHANPKDMQLLQELLKRKLRTPYINQLFKDISADQLRELFHAIHPGENPKSGLLPTVATMINYQQSFLPLSVFASLYRHASLLDITTQLDPDAVLFAWDFFCQLYPNHAQERRPYGIIRPANFSEAWAIALGIKIGAATVQYCKACRGDYLVIYGSKFETCCQICRLDAKRNVEKNLSLAYRFRHEN